MAERSYTIQTHDGEHTVQSDAFGIDQNGVLEFREQGDEGAGWSTVAAYGPGQWVRVYRSDVSE